MKTRDFLAEEFAHFFVVAIAQLRLQHEGEHAVVEIDGERGIATSFMDHRRALEPVVLSWVFKTETLANRECFIVALASYDALAPLEGGSPGW